MGRIEKANHHILNPCVNEQQMTYKCFDENNYDKEKCTTAMENYHYCKSFWNFVQTQRRREGKHPVLPPIEQREAVKNHYIEAFMKAKP